MKEIIFSFSLGLIGASMMQSCDSKAGLLSTREIYVTSESGDKIALQENVSFARGNPEGTVIRIDPDIKKQTLDGIGSSFTESSAFDLAQFSRTIRPGDRAVQTYRTLEGNGEDDLHACATINGDNVLSVQLLNTTRNDISCKLQIREQFAELKIAANSVQTIRVQL
jgi:hypothetical protein